MSKHTIKARNVLLAGIAMLTASLLAACGSSSGNTNASDGDDSSSPNATAPIKGGDPIVGEPSSEQATEPTQSSQPTSESNSNGVVNYVDNHNGVTIFGSSSFAAFTTGKSSHAPFGEKLVVECYVINATGQYASVNALYLIKGGKWNGGYVPANVMLNSATAKLGDATTPSLDDRVPAC